MLVCNRVTGNRRTSRHTVSQSTKKAQEIYDIQKINYV